MNVCTRSECHTTAGCAHRGPRGELCWWPEQGSYEKVPGFLREMKPLSGYTDDEIAAEHYRRALRKLGDQRVGVGGQVFKQEDGR